LANEISITVSGRYEKGYLKDSFGVSGFQITMAGDQDSKITQSIPTTAGGTALAVNSGITSKGIFFFRNLEPEDGNFVDVGVRDGSSNFIGMIRLMPGEFTVGRLKPSATIYALADTAAVLLEHRVIEA
jgi:hypothetical protein